MDELKERIKYVRNSFNIGSQEKMATLLNVNGARVKSIETGRVKDLTAIEANILVKNFNLNIDWLLTGEGEMLTNNEITNDKTDLVELPYFAETYAAAGGGALNYDETKKPIAFDKSFLEKMLGITVFKNLHIINAIGNSMEPTITEGELLFVNPFENESCQIKDGGIYVVNCNNSTFVKRISHNPISGATLLKSDNTTYPDMEITGQEFEACLIIGRVVGHFANF